MLPFLVLPIVILVPIQLLKNFAPEDIKPDIEKQFKIFDNKHTWIMRYYSFTRRSKIVSDGSWSWIVHISVEFTQEHGDLHTSSLSCHECPISSCCHLCQVVWVSNSISLEQSHVLC